MNADLKELIESFDRLNMSAQMIGTSSVENLSARANSLELARVQFEALFKKHLMEQLKSSST